jgi:rare lipoprotein A
MLRVERLLILSLSIALAGACAGRRAPTTAPAAKPRTEVGLASWYGKAHHGKRTASGERFDMYALTAAHRTLAFGSIVRVKSLDSGESVNVRINDRGPFRDGRIIDLSYAAAKKLGFIGRGTARVEITVIERG